MQKFLLSLWFYCLLFAIYIIIYYGSVYYSYNIVLLNDVLSDLYRPGEPIPNLAMFLHLLSGAILLIIGPLQFTNYIREQYLSVHKLLGKIYVINAYCVSMAGFVFILARGTSGGFWMSLGFFFYGILIFFLATMVIKTALQENIPEHKKWVLRLFAVGIGAFLYRIEYALWGFVNNGVIVGHIENDWDGWFDKIMSFAFYLPNLLLVELYLSYQERIKTILNKHKVLTTLFFYFTISSVIIGGSLCVKLWWWPQVKLAYS